MSFFTPTPHPSQWCLVFVDRETEINRQNRERERDRIYGPPLTELLEEVDLFLMLERNISVKLVKKANELCEYICSVSHCLIKGTMPPP